MTERYCFTDTASVSRAHVARWCLVGVAAALAAVTRAPFVRRLVGRPPRELAGSALRVLLAIGLAFVVTDLFLRARRKSGPAAPLKVFAHQPFETFTSHWGGRDVHYAAEAHGYRARDPNDVIDFDEPTLVFSGESVMLGAGLEYDETIPALVGARTGMQTVNLGVAGYASDLSLLRLQSELPRFAHPVAVVTLVLTNWIQRSEGEEREHLAPAPDGTAVLVGPGIPELLRSSPLFSALHTAMHYHGAGAIENAHAVVKSADAYARSRGAKPVFVFTNAGTRCLDTSIRDKITAGLALAHVDVDLPPDRFIPGDVHPDAKGAAILAEAILGELRAQGVGR
jgi:hypothetical protein